MSCIYDSQSSGDCCYVVKYFEPDEYEAQEREHDKTHGRECHCFDGWQQLGSETFDIVEAITNARELCLAFEKADTNIITRVYHVGTVTD